MIENTQIQNWLGRNIVGLACFLITIIGFLNGAYEDAGCFLVIGIVLCVYENVLS